MKKEIAFNHQAKDKLLQGVLKLSNAVTATLGPSGRNVLIEREGQYPISTKDGVTVAKNIELEDPIENMGAQLVKQVASNTNDQAGDGTTTSTLLAASFFEQGLNLIKKGTDIVQLKNGISYEVKKAVDLLDKYSVEVTVEGQLEQIATISANNDPTIGRLVATAMEKVGVDGVVAAEESKSGETFLDSVEGMQFERGYKSPYFVTDNNTMLSILNEPFILILDKRISQVKELLPILEAISQSGKPLLLIAQDIEGEALSTLVVNKMRGILQCAAVKAPDFGDRRTNILNDIATLTGGEVVSEERGMRLESFNQNWLGKAKKVTVSKTTTTIIDALGDEEKIEERILELKSQIDNTAVPFEREVLQDRLAKMIGGVAIIHVGGASEVEMKEKKDRVDDALHATRAALEEGIVPGGGIALLNISSELNTQLVVSIAPEDHEDFKRGRQLVHNVLLAPFIKILANAGKTKAEVAELVKVLTAKGEFSWEGYNPKVGKVVDMFKEGIIDPAKVTRLSLENAASVAGTLLTTEATITITPKQEKGIPQMDPMQGFM